MTVGKALVGLCWFVVQCENRSKDVCDLGSLQLNMTNIVVRTPSKHVHATAHCCQFCSVVCIELETKSIIRKILILVGPLYMDCVSCHLPQEKTFDLY